MTTGDAVRNEFIAGMQREGLGCAVHQSEFQGRAAERYVIQIEDPVDWVMREDAKTIENTSIEDALAALADGPLSKNAPDLHRSLVRAYRDAARANRAALGDVGSFILSFRDAGRTVVEIPAGVVWQMVDGEIGEDEAWKHIEMNGI